MSIGAKIKETLAYDGKSVAWLSRETGIPATTLRSALSKEDGDNISVKMLYKISNALDVSLSDLSDGKYTFTDISEERKDFEAEYAQHIFNLCDYEYEPVTRKDNSTAYVISTKGKIHILGYDEFNDLVKGSKEAAAQYVRDALEKKE